MLISDLSPYIWLFALTASVFATVDSEESFGFATLAGAFTAMLFGFTGLCFYIQCAVFFATQLTVLLAAAIAGAAYERKNK